MADRKNTEAPRARNSGDKPSSEEVNLKENDALLYLWQRATYMDSENGRPREVSDSLRLRIALLSSYHSKL